MKSIKPRKLKDTVVKKIALRNKLAVKNVDYCEKCGTILELTLEHIVPFWFLKDNLGYSLKDSYRDEWNFKILCRECNQEKSDEIDFRYRRVRENFLRYLDKIPLHD